MRSSGISPLSWVYEVGGKTAMALKLLFTDGEGAARAILQLFSRLGNGPAIAPSGSDEHLQELFSRLGIAPSGWHSIASVKQPRYVECPTDKGSKASQTCLKCQIDFYCSRV